MVWRKKPAVVYDICLARLSPSLSSPLSTYNTAVFCSQRRFTAHPLCKLSHFVVAKCAAERATDADHPRCILLIPRPYWRRVIGKPKPKFADGHSSRGPPPRRHNARLTYARSLSSRQVQQEAQLSPSDRAMCLVSSNLANYHATVQKLLIRQVLTKPMV